MADRHAGGEDSDDRFQKMRKTPGRYRWQNKNSDIMSTIRKGLRELWATGCLSDVSLQAEGREFKAHRVVLAAASPFFMAMFSGVWAETRNQKPIEMKGVTAVGLQDLLKFIYTGTLALGRFNSFEFLMAADHLQVQPAINYTIDYMVDNSIPIENSVDVLNYAHMHSLEDLEIAARQIVGDNFEEVLKMKYHLDLDLDNLLYFLNCSQDGEDAIQFGPEIALFCAVVEWLQHDENRMKHLEQLMDVIRFPLMSEEELENIPGNYPFIYENTHAQKLITDAQIYRQKPIYGRILVDSQNTIVRSRESVLIADLVQPEKTQAFTLSTHQGIRTNPVEGKWKLLKDFPGVDLGLDDCTGDICTVIVNGFLVVLVERRLNSVTPSEEPTVKLSAQVFDPRRFEWSQLATYTTKTQYTMHTAAATKENIVAFMNNGGRAAELLIYSFETNTWRNVPHKSPKLTQYSVCATDCSVYAIRVKGNMVKANVYQPHDEKWFHLPNLYEYSSSDRSESYVFHDRILHIGVGEDLTFSYFSPGPESWLPIGRLWYDYDNPDLLVQSARVLCGDNLFSLSNKEDDPHTSEFTIGEKFNEGGYNLIEHEGLPLDFQRGCLAVALRIPQNRCEL